MQPAGQALAVLQHGLMQLGPHFLATVQQAFLQLGPHCFAFFAMQHLVVQSGLQVLPAA